jgi:hypothetical protein
VEDIFVFLSGITTTSEVEITDSDPDIYVDIQVLQ